MHVMHAFHACHARMSRISRPCAQFSQCYPCSIRPLGTHFRRYFRALGEGSVPIGGNSFQLSASSSHRWAGSSVPPAPVFSSLWRSIGRDSGAILSKKGHQCASCSIRPWEMSFLAPFSNIISPTWGPTCMGTQHGDPTCMGTPHGDPTCMGTPHGDPTCMGTPHASESFKMTSKSQLNVS